MQNLGSCTEGCGAVPMLLAETLVSGVTLFYDKADLVRDAASLACVGSRVNTAIAEAIYALLSPRLGIGLLCHRRGSNPGGPMRKDSPLLDLKLKLKVRPCMRAQELHACAHAMLPHGTLSCAMRHASQGDSGLEPCCTLSPPPRPIVQEWNISRNGSRMCLWQRLTGQITQVRITCPARVQTGTQGRTACLVR